ncbi:Hydroxyacylglutathione hydrolase [Candidatus Profftia lariciata]|uniref:hydroxyacylglutathione hydrolase n=1 Tax=Candidatus Profftia lariciata TaxID=1987921 RepID=UPI001D0255ED|nr:hydroxyacylglutathione hydrolase [Candidatus Profftia lariciata]UDG81445.1 Hydroxyacylglutathione hydrolase [Candidatus Profftia lariciata]
MNLIRITAMQDNYIWLLFNIKRESIIIDPGIAPQVLQCLKKNNLSLKAILLTHHHDDHVGGVSDILQHYPDIPVYGPLETINKGCNRPIIKYNKITILDIVFKILHTPGHTLGHLTYYAMPYLFCGDTLFSAGCGRIFEGTPQQMYYSLQLIAQLPNNTLICCAHEYTQLNLKFARSVLSKNQYIKQYQKKINQLRLNNQASVPSLLSIEKKINPFLRCYDNALELNYRLGNKPNHLWEIFARLRKMKDQF